MKLTKKYGIIIKLSWRSVWRNKRRTILTLLTIMAGCSMIILMDSFHAGTYAKMIDDAVELNVGHIQIHEKGFWDNMTIDYAFQPDESLYARLRSMPEIAGYARRVHAAGLLSFKDTTCGSVIQGVDPVEEKKVGSLHKFMKKGRYLLPGDTTHAVIGEVLAKNLGADAGDVVSIISQGFDGSIAVEKLTIVGIFKAPNPEYDRGLMLMPIDQANETFSMMDYISAIVIRVKETRNMEIVRDVIREHIPKESVEVLGWDQLMPEMVQFITMDKFSGDMFIVILYLIVAFGVLNTIQMSVFERIREFGVMLAIGTRPTQVRSMIIVESFFVALAGVIIGIIIGGALSYYFQINPMEFSELKGEMEVWGVSTTIFPAKLTIKTLVQTSLTTLVLSCLFSIMPARKAAGLKPIEAIRHL